MIDVFTSETLNLKETFRITTLILSTLKLLWNIPYFIYGWYNLYNIVYSDSSICYDSCGVDGFVKMVASLMFGTQNLLGFSTEISNLEIVLGGRNLRSEISAAAQEFAADVRGGTFPGAENTFN